MNNGRIGHAPSLPQPLQPQSTAVESWYTQVRWLRHRQHVLTQQLDGDLFAEQQRLPVVAEVVHPCPVTPDRDICRQLVQFAFDGHGTAIAKFVVDLDGGKPSTITGRHKGRRGITRQVERTGVIEQCLQDGDTGTCHRRMACPVRGMHR